MLYFNYTILSMWATKWNDQLQSQGFENIHTQKERCGFLIQRKHTPEYQHQQKLILHFENAERRDYECCECVVGFVWDFVFFYEVWV